MALKPYHTIDEMLTHVNQARPLEKNHPEQKNAVLNRFKYKKYVGSDNQTIIVKEFNDTSYNGPTTHDFIERLNVLYAAVKTLIPEEKLAELNQAKQLTTHKINQNCIVTPREINELLNHEKDLIKVIHKARSLLQEFVSKAIFLINPDAFKNDALLTKTLALLTNIESTITAKKGRPNFINYYPVKDITRVSINRVVGQAIPSTERMGSKLPNFVECGVGYMDHGKYISQFKGYRHSSYTPIKRIDPKYDDSNYQRLFANRKTLFASINHVKFERRQAAALCAKDMFAELARQQIAKGANTKYPIPVTLSSLTMLSPIKGDKTFMRRGESEHRQLKESYNALMMHHNREIKIKVDGQEVTVKPSINIMNVASNWHGVKMSHYLPSNLEKNINAQGLNQYITETEKYLKLDFIRNNEVINKLLEDQLRVKNQLTGLYNSLDAYLASDKNASTDPTYIQLLQSIKKIQHTIDSIEQQILSERLNIIKAQKPEIQAFVEKIVDKKSTKSNNDTIAELYYQSLFMYLDKTIEPVHFGARFLLVNEKMGHAVDFYCKSGEDRTGRMQNLIEELCEFSRQHNHYPRYDFNKKSIYKSDEQLHRVIAQTVSERSVSRDNTNANAKGARGLQITSAIELNTGLPNRSGSLTGTLARGVYDPAAIKKFWRTTLQPLLVRVAQKVKSSAIAMKDRMKQIREPSITTHLRRKGP